jgi:hypothetical protein
MEPVSVESSPRYTECPGAPRKSRFTRSEERSESPSRSLSPRNLFNASPSVPSSSYEALPVSISSLLSNSANECKSAGECGVCYLSLPLRANHVFTTCGHLFCVTCLITWCNSSNSCPMCRAAIVQSQSHPQEPHSVARNDGDGDGDDGDDDGSGSGSGSIN